MTRRELKGFYHFLAIPLAAAISAGMIHPAAAQELRGRVQGVVTDSSGAVIPGALVALRNINTNVSATGETNEVGRYLFGYVLPGTYELSVELDGFRSFRQENILVQTRADITVNASLEVGAVAETVVVEEAPVAVKFNSTTMETTLDTKMANELPIIHRNPFLLAQLDPAVQYRGGSETSPYHHWAASQMDVGGDTAYKNNILLDGVPQLVGAKGTYVPAMDAVSEVNVQQNAVDAEYGHSAGGTISVQMKSGSNEWHGSAYFFGRNPALNARPNPLTAQESTVRRNVWGGTSGNPIVKNKVFNFFTYEGQNTREPRTLQLQMPTQLERNGDFSNSLNRDGGLRSIFDPFTTAVTGPSTATREAFANNVIPQTRLDTTARRVMQDMWEPNGPGDPFTGANNFRFTFPQQFSYYNISDRVDYNVTDNVKIFYRLSRFKTTQSDPDFTAGSPLQPMAGSARNTWQTSGDVVWTINPTTVLNVRGSWSKIKDAFAAPDVEIGTEGLAELWPGNEWYASHVRDIPAVFHPQLDVRADSRSQFGRFGFWFQTPTTYNYDAKISKQAGRHYLKIGHQYRAQRISASRPRGIQFVFQPTDTASTFFSPNTGVEGNAFASMMLGVVSSGNVQTAPINRPHDDAYGFYVHDDFKINQRVTLNIGLRWEYETALRDEERRLSRFIDFDQPLPGLQEASQPLPDQATALRNAPLLFNGAWVFTDDANRGMWDPPKDLFLPRVGLAIRIDNKTALRIGYARYATPSIQERGSIDPLGSTPHPGFTATTTPLTVLQGLPRTQLSNPFPGSGVNQNPLQEPIGKSRGIFTTVGNGGNPEGIFFHQDWKAGINDRFNFTLQRELPGRIVIDTTFFMNFGRNHAIDAQINRADPRIGFANQSAVTASVPNPFFGIDAEIMPGPLRNNQNVSVEQLLRPYPFFLDLEESALPRGDVRYKSFQLKLQRPFSNGFNFLLGYNYNRGRLSQWFDNVDEFDQVTSLQKDPDQGHSLTFSSIYELPFGRDRRFGTQMPGALNAIFGGWSVSGIYRFVSGQLLQFPTQQLISDDVKLDNPTRDEWFNTSAFQTQAPFTRRTNPWFVDGVRGPRFSNLDMTLNKKFQVTEKLGLEFRMEAYNLTNSFMGANPSTDVNNGNFGRITTQLATHSGREWQYSARLFW